MARRDTRASSSYLSDDRCMQSVVDGERSIMNLSRVLGANIQLTNIEETKRLTCQFSVSPKGCPAAKPSSLIV